MKSYMLVFLQFTLIFIMLLPLGNPTQTLTSGVIVMSLGFSVGGLALLSNKLGNFNIRPDIKEEGVLVTSGIYSYIRHPMYTSVILIMLGVLIIYPYEFEYIVWSLLVLVLLLKLHYEELLWKSTSSEYLAYSKRSQKLIPFIY